MRELVIILRSQFPNRSSANVPLEVIDEHLRRLTGQPDSIEFDSEQRLQVPPGKYLVRVYLPDQGIIDRQVTVGEQSGPYIVEMGQKKDERVSEAHTPFRRKSGRSFLGTSDLLSDLDMLYLRETTIVFEFRHPIYLRRHPLSDRRRNWARHPARFDGYFSTFPQEFGITFFSHPENLRQYAIVNPEFRSETSPGSFHKVFLIPPFTEGRAVFFAEMSPNSKGAREELDYDSFMIDFEGADPQATALLAFLMRGNFDAVNQLSGQLDDFAHLAERYLLEKYSNPMNAVIGGYLLIKTGNLDKLHNWTINLKDGFRGIPDGAIIHAWFILLRQEGGFEEALESLLDAYTRGIPHLSIGARLLYDGLTFYKNHSATNIDQKAKVEHALEDLTPLLGTIDWSKPFTVLQLPDLFPY